MSEPLLKLYAVRNSDGLYFKSRGYSGYGKMWVELRDAKTYGKIGQARSRITFFARNYKDFPPPELVELHVTAAVVLDETARLEKVVGVHARKQEEQKVRQAKMDLEYAYEDLKLAEQKIEKARKTARRYGVKI